MTRTMDTNKRDIVGTATVGDGPKALVDRAKTLRFVFHNFEGMEEGVTSPALEAFGYSWGLDFYPKGRKCSDTDADTEWVSAYLRYMGDDKYAPSARFVIRCKEYEKSFATRLFRKEEAAWGRNTFLKREDVLENYLEEDGSLSIEVDIQITVDSKRVWYPKTIPTETSLKQLFVDAAASSTKNPTEEESENDTTDIVFIVDDELFPVHKFVLSLHAKTLFAFYKEHVIGSKKRKRNGTTGTNNNDEDEDNDDDDDDRARVHIPDMNSETFQKVLEYIYTINITPTLVDVAAATELLLAAHRFECATLQLYVESVLVDKFVTPTNAAAMLLLGDSHSCALLKEAAMQSYFADPTSFRDSDTTTTASWSKIQESSRLLEELLVYTSNKLVANRNPTAAAAAAATTSTLNSAGGTNNATVSSTGTETNAGAVPVVMVDDNCTTMDVGTLREHLEDASLALDGSREVLVRRLRDYRQQQ